MSRIYPQLRCEFVATDISPRVVDARQTRSLPSKLEVNRGLEVALLNEYFAPCNDHGDGPGMGGEALLRKNIRFHLLNLIAEWRQQSG